MAPDPFTYAGAARSAMSGAAAVASALRSAADQEQARQERQRKQTLAEQLDMARLIGQGWQIYEPSQNVKGTSSGLKTRDYTPPPSNLVTLPTINKQLFRPAPVAKPDATPQQTYTDLATALSRGGQPLDENGNIWQDTQTPRLRETQPDLSQPSSLANTGLFGVHVPPPEPARVITPPGSKQRVYMPPQADTLAEKLRVQAAGKSGIPHIDTKTFTAPLLIDPVSGQATKIKLPAGVTLNEKPEPAEKYKYFTDEAGRATRVPQEGNPEQWNGKGWVTAPAGVGPRHKDPNAPPAERKATAAQLRAVVTKKAQRLKDAEAQFVKAHKNWDALTDQEQAVAQDDLWKAKQAAETEYVDSLASYGIQATPFDYAGQRAQLDAQGPAQPAPAGTGALPSQDRAATPAAPGKKTVTLNQIDAYVEAKRKTDPAYSKRQAVRDFKRDGYRITVGQ